MRSHEIPPELLRVLHEQSGFVTGAMLDTLAEILTQHRAMVLQERNPQPTGFIIPINPQQLNDLNNHKAIKVVVPGEEGICADTAVIIRPTKYT